MREELERLRKEIDQIDADILLRLNRRAQIAQRIGELKQGAIYRPEREAQILKRLISENRGPLEGESVGRVFREIMSACLALEQALRIAHLGPPGTFSESAVRKHFGGAPELSPLATIDDVFRAVEAGNVDYGVVPVENSTEGTVGRTLDLLLATPLLICGEVELRIHQNLMSKAESVGGLKRLYSHGQSLAQCHEWLNRNVPNLVRIPVASNAEAARLASEDAESAAVAGEAAAKLCGLNILAQSIEDDPNNTTRFLVLGRHDAGLSGDDKTSFVCSAQNRPGAMHALLEPLASKRVSMTKLESRPSRAGLWEYVFYVDIQGHQDDPAVAEALTELRDKAAFLKILGSYPCAIV